MDVRSSAQIQQAPGTAAGAGGAALAGENAEGGSDTGSRHQLLVDCRLEVEALASGSTGPTTRPWRPSSASMLFLIRLSRSRNTEWAGGEASLTPPSDLKSVNFANFGGLNGHALLSIGLLFCVGGLLFGLAIYVAVRRTCRSIAPCSKSPS